MLQTEKLLKLRTPLRHQTACSQAKHRTADIIECQKRGKLRLACVLG